jgi:hypothetical protein
MVCQNSKIDHSFKLTLYHKLNNTMEKKLAFNYFFKTILNLNVNGLKVKLIYQKVYLNLSCYHSDIKLEI